MSEVKKKKKKIKVSTILIYIILSLWGITTIFPFVWVINNSFKPSREVVNSSFSLPIEFTMQNYVKAFDNLNILEAYKNSFIISGSVTIAVMILASMIAFAMTRYKFRGREFIHSLIIASLMFPVFSTIIPVFKMMSQANLISNPLSVIIPQIAGNLSFASVIMMGYLRGLPIEMEEAAYMEGANIRQVFTRIIVPLCKPSLATVGIFCFLWSYNDLFTQLIMIRRRTKFPICALLNEISSKYGIDYGLMASSITIIIIPVLIVYICLQKNIIKGLTAGAVKG
ncbi:carbohydrate ABC transporter permease [Anaerocolumna aminovalerica]|uniref:Carbohydrate ABC transporter membrane protein 2, CUT1 family n=1 Tax=Anaerocolumna aminovalerica TaxID=1527 RepID=A0A1I5D929_9FIRM|nr:carbohydrate ABC transporter permease [Anaerocolumna aminovalerica]MBU5332416.1 carbohydrate ABC transporter permease [Anaerocolumna aminovalerica]MDU6263098.1 carbohydrate ABC transporter permease [Anaerocolumna aminovalerica]SFN95778.1 carbohydrate ABC transporter membrane protein 2, CUT1 family [Anaerocolumna aminovalerica]